MSIRKLPDGRYEWRHRVGGRHLKKVFARKIDATAHDAKVKADLARGTHVDTSNRVTVAEYARAWSEARVLRPNTRRTHESMLRNHIEGTALGARPVVRVRPSEVQAWAAGRAAVLGPSVRPLAGFLRSVFAAAVLDGVIARNPVQPASRLSLPRHDRPKFTPLTVAQVRAWAAAELPRVRAKADAPMPRVRAMIITQAATGLRISELRALRVEDVDFLRREVRIDVQLDRHGTHRVPLKTARSRRVVPLPRIAAEALAEHIRKFPPVPGGLIFTDAAGHPWRGHLRQVYSDAAAAAGLPAGTTSHDLRHHYASVLLAAGESVHAVAERLGDTPAMVLSTYGHVMPDQEDTTRRAVDAAWKAAGDQAAEGTL
jgi:integrase